MLRGRRGRGRARLAPAPPRAHLRRPARRRPARCGPGRRGAEPDVDAFALPGRPGRIVVTTGMRDALDPDLYAAMIAHERCHLDERHHHLVWLARLGAAIHPVLTPMVRHVEYLVERAADEAAADALGNRPQVASAIGTAALRVTARTARNGMLHLGRRGRPWCGGDRIAQCPAAGPVPRRPADRARRELDRVDWRCSTTCRS